MPELLKRPLPIGVLCKLYYASCQANGHGRLVGGAQQGPWPASRETQHHRQPELASCRSGLRGASDLSSSLATRAAQDVSYAVSAAARAMHSFAAACSARVTYGLQIYLLYVAAEASVRAWAHSEQ